MSDKNMTLEGMDSSEDRGNRFNTEGRRRETAGEQNRQVDVFYIVNQINKVLEQADYLHEAIASLSKMSDGESGEPYGAGNIMGQAKANALKDIVCYRETTNQQVLKMYEKMYDDLCGRHSLDQDITECCREIIEEADLGKMDSEDIVDLVHAIGDTIHTAKLDFIQKENSGFVE